MWKLSPDTKELVACGCALMLLGAILGLVVLRLVEWLLEHSRWVS